MSVISGPIYKAVEDLKRTPVIATPRITSPDNGSTGESTSLAAECTSMYSIYRTDIEESQWQLATSSTFDSADIVEDETKTSDHYTFSYSLDTETSYSLRVRFKDNKGFWSSWSEVVSFSTGSVSVTTPSNVSPTDGETGIGERPWLEISSFEVDGISESNYDHVASQFRIYEVSTGDMIHDSGELGDVIEYEVPSGELDDGETEYEWEARVEDGTYGWSDWSTRTSFVTEDSFFEDGSSLDGLDFDSIEHYDSNTDTGYFGEVSASTLFTGNDLASEIGLSAGTGFNSDEPWLKFYVGPDAVCNRNNGEAYILYVAKKPYRNNLSWNDIDGANAVYPDGITVSKDDLVFDVRLLTGGDGDPISSDADDELDPVEGEGSEWNELIYRIHTDEPSRQKGDNWETFTDSGIVVGDGDGRRTWCQETSPNNTSKRVGRGDSALAFFHVRDSSGTDPKVGWRPALQLRP